MRIQFAACFAILIGLGCGAASAAPDDATLPIQRVTLYTSGVGYFERSGEVSGDATETLLFPVDQVNDVLKSLVLLDFGGGSVQPVTYGAQDPVTKQLQAFSVDLSDNPDRPTLLNRLRGANAVVTVAGAPGQTLTGAIMGVESATVTLPNNGGTVTQNTLNIMAADGIHSIKLDDVASVQLTDPKLNEELTEALGVIAEGRDSSKRPVTIGFTGQGSRKVLVGYLTATPLWQTTYRLVLGDSPVLQGWALVQNTSQDDWSSVNLSLVSGRPISFIQDLYTPIYVTRPTVAAQVAQAPGPVAYDSNTAAEQQAPAFMAGARASYDAPVADGAFRAEVTNRSDRDLAKSMLQQSGAQAAGAKLGTALFRYDIKTPVSVPRQQSAMIPFVSSPIQATAVSIYNASVEADHPLSGARLKNTSGLHLMGGPITVFDQSGGDSGYVGDSEIDDTEPGQTRLISYAVDLAVDASSEEGDDTGESISLVINKGVLVETINARSSTIYTFKNNASKERTIVVEQPYQGDGWTYVTPAAPTEHTAGTDRFDVDVPAGASKKFTVTLEQPQEQTYGLIDADLGTLVAYTKEGKISDDVRSAIQEVIRRREALAHIQSEIANRQAKIADISAGQDRIRDNMKALDHSSALYKRYVGELDAQETSIDGLQSEIDQLQSDAAAAQQQLSDYVSNLTLQ